jgi:hypothetical protein
MLIQFLPDRLLLNWRRHHDHSIEYPRYENLREKFEIALKSLDKYFRENFKFGLLINQCEASYFNTIPLSGKASDWISCFSDDSDLGDEFNLMTRYVCRDSDGAPFARVHMECVAGRTPVNQSVIALNITFRGPPKSDAIEDALRLIDCGRNEIVHKFDSVTTGSAHKVWGKI